MLLAEVEVRHSRSIAPTRRVALGFTVLPIEPAPGWGPVLLAGVVAAMTPGLDDDLKNDLYNLVDALEAGASIAQPRLRHRFQKDVIGLDRSVHSLVSDDSQVYFDIDDHALPEVNALAAVYACAAIPIEGRTNAFRCVRKALLWNAPLGLEFVSHMLGEGGGFGRWFALPTDSQWAMRLLGYGPSDHPSVVQIKERFRERVWAAHPDRGGNAEAMMELNRARRILLSA
jgi:hypothetical protein